MRNWFLNMFLGSALSALATAASAETQGVSLTEFPVENQALINATVAFFESVETRTEPRTRMPVIGLPLTATRSKAGSDDASILTRMGPVHHLTGYRITWYPMDQLYGTVDFMGTWDGNRNLVCGYLTWDLADPKAPVLTSVSASFVDMGDLSQASDEDIHIGLLDANCAFGSIDENYGFFDVTG
ncbi:MAG: hypothetical protein LJE62_16095 [Silicimonas sp.]|jgi:hypothetical protein|nr:hypothetical protein [Silicimonas sp.]